MKLRAVPYRVTQDGQAMVERWQKVIHWRREWQTTSVFLPWEPYEQWDNRENKIIKSDW